MPFLEAHWLASVTLQMDEVAIDLFHSDVPWCQDANTRLFQGADAAFDIRKVFSVTTRHSGDKLNHD